MTYSVASDRPGYKHNALCKVCNYRDKSGRPIRMAVEDMVAKGVSYNRTARWIVKHFDLKVNRKNVALHIKQHAPYSLLAKAKKEEGEGGKFPGRKITLKQKKDALAMVQEQFADANVSLQRIINIGDHLIKTGQMPVSEKLFMDALKEQGRREQPSSLDLILVDMEKDWLKKNAQEGEVLNEKGRQADTAGSEKPQSGSTDARPVQKQLVKRLPQPGTVRNLVHVRV